MRGRAAFSSEATQLVGFGKYKDKTYDEVKSDSNYLDYLASMPRPSSAIKDLLAYCGRGDAGAGGR